MCVSQHGFCRASLRQLVALVGLAQSLQPKFWLQVPQWVGKGAADGMLSMGTTLHRCVAQGFPVGREVSPLGLLKCEAGGVHLVCKDSEKTQLNVIFIF